MTHLKRIVAPKSWKVTRKTSKWIVSPRPGPHPKERGIPLLILIRDLLKIARTAKEAKRILKSGEVVVDGRVRKDHKFPCGFFDIISIPKIEKNYCILPDHKARLSLREIPSTKSKLCKVVGKRMVKGGKIQLNLHDGRNLLSESPIKRKDSVVISIPDGKILRHYPYQEGATAYIIGGKHAGRIGKIREIKKLRSSNPNRVVLEIDGSIVETLEDYVFVVGKEEYVRTEKT
jgi:small subunit ribosomal protein S4e